VVQPVETLQLIGVQLTPLDKGRGGVPLAAALAPLLITRCCCCCCWRGVASLCGAVQQGRQGAALLLLLLLLLLFLLLSEERLACGCVCSNGGLTPVVSCYFSSKVPQVLQSVS
jgi:hypothetical protein